MKFTTARGELSGEREVLVTLRHGRLYTVTLDVNLGKMESYNADVFAVVAGLRFLQPTMSSEETPSAKEPDETADDEMGSIEPGRGAAAPTDRTQ